MTFKGHSPLFPNLGGQASQQGGVKGREVELEISLLAITNYKNLLRITIWAEEFFHRGVDLNPYVVHSPQSAVPSLQLWCCSVWCFLFNVVGEPLTESVKFLPFSFRALWSQCFEKQKHRFSSSSKYGSGMDSEMTQHILFENEQKYFSRLKHADTVALTRAPKNGLLHWKIFHSSLFK